MSDSGSGAVQAPAFGVVNSFSGRNWYWRARHDERALKLARGASISLTLAQLLHARGVTVGEAEAFLNPTIKELLPEPLLFRDMERAIRRSEVALEKEEKIAIFGDYDVDGSASTAMLADFFTAIGANPRIYIPDRMSEGYGPSARALRVLMDEGISLVITVDCGASAYEALAAAKDDGQDVIVLEHHAVERRPPVSAHINPNQPGDETGQRHLCAAGVAFLYLVGLNRQLRNTGFYEQRRIEPPDLRRALDLVGLATICDMVPLVGVNRAFVRAGLRRMSMAPRPGIAALARIAAIAAPFTAHHLSFVFGPRINAGGRVGSCSLGTALLGARDEASARELATLLDLHNRERQEIEKAISDGAMEQALSQSSEPFLFLVGAGWHSGVVGIVAGRLKDRFLKPSFVIGLQGGEGRGSARSIDGVNVGALVRSAKNKGLVDTGGGHAMAAGFSLRSAQLEPFKAFLAAEFPWIGQSSNIQHTLEIEAAVSPAAATDALAREMELAGPFGVGNPEPNLAVPDAELAYAAVVGQNHVRVRLKGGAGAPLEAIAFRSANEPLGKALLGSRGQRIHVAGRLRAEIFRERMLVRLHIEDAAAASA